MPTYEYECSACKHHFDLFQSITAKPIKKCPACHKARVRRLIGTGAGIIFKGSGFYQTDYRSEAYRRRAKEEKSGSAASAGPKEESKSSPAAPAPAKAKPPQKD